MPKFIVPRCAYCNLAGSMCIGCPYNPDYDPMFDEVEDEP